MRGSVCHLLACLFAYFVMHIALHLNLRHADVFHGAACLSPCFNPGILANVAAQGKALLRNKKIYLDIGGDLGDETADAAKGAAGGAEERSHHDAAQVQVSCDRKTRLESWLLLARHIFATGRAVHVSLVGSCQGGLCLPRDSGRSA